MLELLKKLCVASGVSGDEGEVREVIRTHAEPFADSITEDALGNLIVQKHGNGSSQLRVMLCAHMDEVGVIATHIMDDGYIKFACAGGIDRRVLTGKRVFFGKNHVPGIIGCRAMHLLTTAELERVGKVDDMYIDIGASSKEEAEKLIELGDTGAFEPLAFEFGDGLFGAKAIDDRIGCAVLLKLLESELPLDCTFVFSVQEEVGARGATVAAFSQEPDFALVVEGTTAADLPGVPDGKRVCSVGGGAVIPFMDGGTISDRGLYKMLTTAAEREGIAWQTKRYVSGGTDASVIQRSRAGVRTLGIAAPVRNLHSPICVGKISDFDGVLKLARLFLEEITNGL